MKDYYMYKTDLRFILKKYNNLLYQRCFKNKLYLCNLNSLYLPITIKTKENDYN